MKEYRIHKIDGFEMASYEMGAHFESTPLIFIHGIATSINFWRVGQTPYIQENFHWCSLSLPGHYPAAFPREFATSHLTPELIADLAMQSIQQLIGDRPFVICGHSTGGFTALAVAARYPERVKGVISVAGFARGKWHGILGLMQKTARMGPLGQMLFKINFGMMKRSRWLFEFGIGMYTADAHSMKNSPYYIPTIDTIYPDFTHIHLDAIMHYFKRMPEIDISTWLPKIRVPTLVVTGADDSIVPASEADWIAKHIPQSTLVKIPESGHVVMAERAEAYNTAIVTWLNAQGY